MLTIIMNLAMSRTLKPQTHGNDNAFLGSGSGNQQSLPLVLVQVLTECTEISLYLGVYSTTALLLRTPEGMG